ncbi:ROK family transcriptional regulator [Tenggerimyces flavus]|uniref:ROK family transcriptional regulator n=1 Tax=Tenggerimyces flavus TaxID=1708749 RepID=A0ABV7YHV4_9ACTN|nr:ROK family transcriptional regulator [Tenggerimyces flavus]MBM7790016.1 putative NBD/HSP70 family sugar kinase [Tenggerimyces flavus]
MSGGITPTSPGEILELIRSGQVTTRRELQDLTGLSRSTVALRLAPLIANGYVRARVRRSGSAGRPANALSFDETGKLILAADLGATHGRYALTDAAGTVLAESAGELSIGSPPQTVLRTVIRRFRDLIRRTDRPVGQLAGIGIGVPGPVDYARGRPVQPPIMPGWHDYPVAAELSAAFDCPAFVDNDANIMGLGEMRTHYREEASLLFVKVSTGIGAGVILSGRPQHGVAGAAGDIGHIRIAHPVEGRRCACGASGCLAAHASGAALARRLSDAGLPAVSSLDVVRLVHEGHPDAIEAVRTAGSLLGEVLSTAIALLNPSVLVLGGDLVLTHEHFLLSVRQAIYERTVPLATRDLAIAGSQLGIRAGVEGARHMVVDEVFSAEAVDARLETLETAGG